MNEIYKGVADESSPFGLTETLDWLPSLSSVDWLCSVLRHALCCLEVTTRASLVSTHLRVICSSQTCWQQSLHQRTSEQARLGRSLGLEITEERWQNIVSPPRPFISCFSWGGGECWRPYQRINNVNFINLNENQNCAGVVWCSERL